MRVRPNTACHLLMWLLALELLALAAVALWAVVLIVRDHQPHVLLFPYLP